MGTGGAESVRRSKNPSSASVVGGNGGLSKVLVTAPEAEGEIYLHGAHITSWKPAGRGEVFFLSSKSLWKDGTAIRGGVPICFPWFGNKAGDVQAPAHGFVRTKEWQLESTANGEDGTTVSMFTGSDEDTKRWVPDQFHLAFRVTFGHDLKVELVVTNTGNQPLRFEEALHAYHRVGNIQNARVKGLQGVTYIDKTDSYKRKPQDGDIAVVSETDRVYLDTTSAIELDDPALRRHTHVEKENSRTTVIWNPWVEKAHAMADFGDDEWTQMICIETSNVGDFAVDLPPGGQHAMKAIVRVSDL
jgi:glucose-6-phosphate 1-epimerase